MGFTFRKLYPTVIEIRDCCLIDCGCWVQLPDGGVAGEAGGAGGNNGCRCPWISWGQSPGLMLRPCNNQDPPTCSVCTSVTRRCTSVQEYISNSYVCWTGFELSCQSLEDVFCECSDGPTTISRWFGWNPPCLELPQDECCPDFVCRDVPEDYVGDDPSGVIPLFENCTISGTKPHTYRFENLGGVPFPCGISNSPEYPKFRINIGSGLSATGYFGDPDFLRDITPYFFPRTRYHTLPSESTPISATYMVDFSRYCMKIHETPSQVQGVGNRVMVFSGRNVYNYTGVLSGDPLLASADPLWDDPGASGLRQLEESLGRSFPLPDSVLTLPLWGETASDNLGLTGAGIEDNDGNSCTKQYIQCCDITPNQCGICVGCECISSDPHAATGHYLPNNQGYTAGYFSFSCFNPFSYLDSIDENTDVYSAGINHQFGLGRLDNTFGCDGYDNGTQLATNCNGFSGATSQGPRLGYPTCSLWSFMIATYARIMKAFVTNKFIIESLAYFENDPIAIPTEADFRDEFPNFTAAITDALAADPRGTRNNTSNVQFHLAKISNGLLIDTRTSPGPKNLAAILGIIELTFPNVFLWDKTAFISATTNVGRWQSLYIVGNGNVIFDSLSLAVTGPAYRSTEDFPPETDAQDYLSFVITLDEVAHEKYANVTGNSHHARLVVFNGSHGPAGTNRLNASSKISLTELPFCEGITSTRYPDFVDGYPPITLCEICNAWPNSVCLTGTESGCGTVNGLNDFGNLCIYPGGFNFFGNCMTAGYQVPVTPSP